MADGDYLQNNTGIASNITFHCDSLGQKQKNSKKNVYCCILWLLIAPHSNLNMKYKMDGWMDGRV